MPKLNNRPILNLNEGNLLVALELIVFLRSQTDAYKCDIYDIKVSYKISKSGNICSWAQQSGEWNSWRALVHSSHWTSRRGYSIVNQLQLWWAKFVLFLPNLIWQNFPKINPNFGDLNKFFSWSFDNQSTSPWTATAATKALSIPTVLAPWSEHPNPFQIEAGIVEKWNNKRRKKTEKQTNIFTYNY